MSEPSLKTKTVHGVGWSAIDALLGYGVLFLVGLVLARLLTPENYGLIGIVSIFITVMVGIVDSGFSTALIRKPKVTDYDFCTLFYFNLLVSLVMYALLFLSAPWIARFFERPQLVQLVRVMGLILVIQAFSIVQSTILNRRIDFKTRAKASVISSVSSGAIGIIMAYTGFGVWSLVAQQLFMQLISAACLWKFNQWWPRLLFSLTSLKYMWGFGWKLLLSGLLDRTWSQLYQTVVGKFYSPATLGQYSRAKDYAHLFSSNFTSIVQRVSYPVLSQVQEDKSRMVKIYRRIIKTTMFVTTVTMIPMGAVAEPLIYCLVGPQWHQAATFLPLICVSLSLYPLHAINLNMLKVQNRTDIFLIIEIVKKVIAIGPLCLGIFVNIYWMLVGSIFTGIISFFLNSYFTGRSLGYTSWMQLKDVSSGYGIAFVVAVSVYFFKYLPVSNFIILPIQLLVGSVVFFFICENVKLPEYLEVKEVAKEYIGKLLPKKNRSNGTGL